MLDARGAGNASSLHASGLDPETLAAARRIGTCAKVGLWPMHAGLEVMPVARRLAQAFETLGDTVYILDTGAPLPPPFSHEEDRPAALEHAFEDASGRYARVLVAFGAPGVAGPAGSLASVLDGVLFIARPGGATEFRLHKLLRQIDPKCRLGVLLVE